MSGKFNSKVTVVPNAGDPGSRKSPDSLTILASGSETPGQPAGLPLAVAVDTTPAVVEKPAPVVVKAPPKVKPPKSETKTPTGGSKGTKVDGGTKAPGSTKTGESANNAAPTQPVVDRPPPAVEKPAPAVERPTAPQSVQVRIGSKQPGATLYVNGVVQGLISSVSWVPMTVNSKGELKLQIRADGCATPWDTTIVVPAGSDKITVGNRAPAC